MKDELRFMDELFRIVNGALRLDIGKVRNYTAFLAEKLEEAGEVAASKRLRKLLEETERQTNRTPSNIPRKTRSRPYCLMVKRGRHRS